MAAFAQFVYRLTKCGCPTLCYSTSELCSSPSSRFAFCQTVMKTTPVPTATTSCRSTQTSSSNRTVRGSRTEICSSTHIQETCYGCHRPSTFHRAPLMSNTSHLMVSWYYSSVEINSCSEQVCKMLFGSWTFNKDEVVLNYFRNRRYVELNDYSTSGIWDIMDVPGQLTENRSRIQYDIKIRR